MILPHINPVETIAWQKLQSHYEQMKSVHMRDLFATDPQRFQKFSLQFEDLLADYSKNIITTETAPTGTGNTAPQRRPTDVCR